METCNPQLIKEQFKRTEGQVLGIGKMIESGRTCQEVVQQIVAARASLTKLGTMLLEEQAKGCLKGMTTSSPEKLKELNRVLVDLFKIN